MGVNYGKHRKNLNCINLYMKYIKVYICDIFFLLISILIILDNQILRKGHNVASNLDKDAKDGQSVRLVDGLSETTVVAGVVVNQMQLKQVTPDTQIHVQ